MLIASLLILGVLLILSEIYLPGLIVGSLGLLCLVAAVVIGYVQHGAATGNTLLLTVLIMICGGTALWLKYFPESRIARPFISAGVAGDAGVDQASLLHQHGVTATALRPSGVAVIAGQRVDVTSEGDMVEAGRPVEVIVAEGFRIVVRELELQA